MKKTDYSIFTKKELVEFLERFEKNFVGIQKPYEILLYQRLDDTDRKIKENIVEGTMITDELNEEKDILLQAKIWARWRDNHKKYQALSKKREDITRLLFGNNKS